MNLIKKTIFFILFLLKELASVEVRYDLTKELNATIVELFRSIEPITASDFIKTVLNLENAHEYPFNWTDKGGKSESMTLNRLEVIRVFDSGCNKSYMRYNFDDHKIEIFSPLLVIKLGGHRVIPIETRSKRYFMKYKCALGLSNYSINVFEHSNQTFHVQYHDDSININDIVARTAIAKQIDVLKHMKHFIVSLSTQNINRGDRIVRKLTETCRAQPFKSLTSKNPQFQKHHKYYYLIPNVSFTSYNFQNVTIEGLTNFQSFSIIQQPLVYTLLIRDVRGSLIMDAGFSNAILGQSSQLDFTIGSLSISVEPNTKVIKVGAANYSVLVAKSKAQFDQLHSAVIIELMEGAIAASIMPSMTFQRTMKPMPTSSTSEHDAEATTVEKIISDESEEVYEETTEKLTTKQSTASQSDWRTESTSCSTDYSDHRTHDSTENPTQTSIDRNKTKTETGTTPSPLKETSTTSLTSCSDQPFNASTCCTTEDRLNYHVLFKNANIKLLSKNHTYPEQVQCELLNNLKFTHKIAAMISNNSKLSCIDFHADVGFVNVSITEPNTTMEEGDDSCEFQIRLNQIINVKVSPSSSPQNRSQKWTEKLSQIKKKIDEILLPVARTPIVRKMRPIARTSLDICSQSVKLIDDWFHRFFDKVQQEFFSRRNTTRRHD